MELRFFKSFPSRTTWCPDLDRPIIANGHRASWNYERNIKPEARFCGAKPRCPSVATCQDSIKNLPDLQERYWRRSACCFVLQPSRCFSRICKAGIGKGSWPQKRMHRTLLKILAEHTALTFDDVDKALLEAETIRNSAAGRYSAPGSANAALRELQSGSSVLVAIGWTDASGDLLAHSYRSEPSRRNISDMPHFIAQRDNPDAGLFIAPPYRSAVGDRWLSAASRRINNPDGSFAGVVTAPIDQAYFTKLYQSIDLGRDGLIILMHREGRIMARVPELKAALGKSFADLPLFTRFLPVSDRRLLRNDERSERCRPYRRLQGGVWLAARRVGDLRAQRRPGTVVPTCLCDRPGRHCHRLDHSARHASPDKADQEARGK